MLRSLAAREERELQSLFQTLSEVEAGLKLMAKAVASFSMEDNKSTSALWLLSTLGGKPRALTHCGDKDGRPQWSPHGDLIEAALRCA